MNVLKNFEALFVVTLGLACAASYALDTNSIDHQAAVKSNVQVVVVSAKRMTAEEKRQSLVEERAVIASSTSPASKI